MRKKRDGIPWNCGVETLEGTGPTQGAQLLVKVTEEQGQHHNPPPPSNPHVPPSSRATPVVTTRMPC